jgi:hypothetical protein
MTHVVLLVVKSGKTIIGDRKIYWKRSIDIWEIHFRDCQPASDDGHVIYVSMTSTSVQHSRVWVALRLQIN